MINFYYGILLIFFLQETGYWKDIPIRRKTKIIHKNSDIFIHMSYTQIFKAHSWQICFSYFFQLVLRRDRSVNYVICVTPLNVEERSQPFQGFAVEKRLIWRLILIITTSLQTYIVCCNIVKFVHWQVFSCQEVLCNTF